MLEMKYWKKFKDILTGNTSFDRRVRKVLFGVEEMPKLPLRGRIVKGVFMGIFLLVFGLWSFSFGVFVSTGTLPFGPRTESIVPPEMQSTVTAAQAEQVIEESLLDLASYGERNNCVELAFVAARQLWWGGYQSTVVRIDFSDGSGHMLVGVPTSDEGWKFLDPQGNVWVSPVVGGLWQGKVITGLYYLSDFVWEAIEVEQK